MDARLKPWWARLSVRDRLGVQLDAARWRAYARSSTAIFYRPQGER